MKTRGEQWQPFRATGGGWGQQTGMYGSVSAGGMYVAPRRQVHMNPAAPSTGYNLARQALPWGTTGHILQPIAHELGRRLRRHIGADVYDPATKSDIRRLTEVEMQPHKVIPIGETGETAQVPGTTLGPNAQTRPARTRKPKGAPVGQMSLFDTDPVPAPRNRNKMFRGLSDMTF